MDIKEKILTPADKFLQSKEYLDLKKEVEDSVQLALKAEDGEEVDIEPVFRLFDQQAKNNVENEVTRVKMFWGVVAKSLKDGEFGKIHTDLGPLLEDASQAEAFLNKRLSGVIERLSRTIYRNLNNRGDALRELKANLYSYFPEIKDLIVGGLEGKKPKTAVPGGKLGKDEFAESFGNFFGGTRGSDEKKSAEWLLEKNWDTPNISDIKPGLIIEVLDIVQNKTHKYLILSEPFYKPIYVEAKDNMKDIFVKAKEIGGSYVIERRMADWGLAPSMIREARWSPDFKPIKWYPYFESSEFKISPGEFDDILKNPI